MGSQLCDHIDRRLRRRPHAEAQGNHIRGDASLRAKTGHLCDRAFQYTFAREVGPCLLQPRRRNEEAGRKLICARLQSVVWVSSVAMANYELLSLKENMRQLVGDSKVRSPPVQIRLN